MGADWDRERKELADSLKGGGYIASPSVRAAFEKVPREHFVPEDVKGSAYEDVPLPIGYGQTISAPSMIAIMLEEAALRAGESVLEIGTGCGYNAALLAEIVGPDRVVSIERHPELAEFGRANLAACGYRVEVAVGGGAEWVHASSGSPRYTGSSGRDSASPSPTIRSMSASLSSQ